MLKSPPPAWSPDREPEPDPQPEPPAGPHPGASPGGPQPSPSPAEPTMEEEFRFLLCQGCHTLAKCPKLLTCLHTLCSGCLEAHGLQCPTCQESQPRDPKEEALDNVFFESLQRRLSLYQQIVEAQALCTRCKEPAVFWCFECEQLLCAKCFEAHQWFLKHEARPLTELRDQTAREFLDGTRKTNNIFCSNPNHRTPALTSIYCRGCSKPLCCSCALLDAGHSDLKCDLGAEVRQRQEELRATAQALQEREHTFADAHAQVRAALSQLGCARADTEELIRASVRQAVARVQAREHALLEALEARFQLERTKLADQLQRLDTVLQRMRTGGALVQRLELYASDQEVLDMHSFLQGALDRLRQEEPEGPGAPRDPAEPRSFAEIEVQLQDLVSCITNAVLTREASPEASSMPQNSLDVELPREEQRTETQSLSQAETQLVAMEQSEPSAPPVPRYNFCMTGPSFREEGSGINPPKKRKSCYTQCPKIIKMESEDEKEARLSASSPEYPIPSTSRAVPHPHLGADGPPSPERPRLGQEILLPQSNHVTSDDPEPGEPVVVISSSDDSEPENLSSHELDGSSEAQLEGPSTIHTLDSLHAEPQVEDRPLIFFDLKIDDKTQKISQLAAVNQDTKFRVLIQPQGVFSVHTKAVSLEAGLLHFLRFLCSMQRPILACYTLWGPALPCFFQALEDMSQLWEFQQAISGFLAVLPLIEERVPGAGSFKLKKLAKTYLARNLSDRSALAAVLAMRDLCRLLEISPGPQLIPHVYPFSNLQCFASLQPLLQAGVLPTADARLLALSNVSFQELLIAHRYNPKGGLKRYGRYLNPQASPASPDPPSPSLHALNLYLDGLVERAALAPEEGISAPLNVSQWS
ncbi:protein PML isoform X1 [Dipodomys spectabilis]|uniref:protein PML isoform X1 n=1 Tax=Dipodomys spectabilis TaxID=105255 RepID=UPI001C5472B5|nr:protein PML isoform X1 [Dipodomys spectabilis]